MSSKLCFLTVGATASFSALIEAAVSPAFLTALESQGYTELSVQYGQDGKQLFDKCKASAQASSKVTVTGFDLDKLGLGKHMRRAKGAKDADEGVVISHAGMICSAWRLWLFKWHTDTNGQALAQFSTPFASRYRSSLFPTRHYSTTTKSNLPKLSLSKNTSCTEE